MKYALASITILALCSCGTEQAPETIGKPVYRWPDEWAHVYVDKASGRRFLVLRDPSRQGLAVIEAPIPQSVESPK